MEYREGGVCDVGREMICGEADATIFERAMLVLLLLWMNVRVE